MDINKTSLLQLIDIINRAKIKNLKEVVFFMENLSDLVEYDFSNSYTNKIQAKYSLADKDIEKIKNFIELGWEDKLKTIEKIKEYIKEEIWKLNDLFALKSKEIPKEILLYKIGERLGASKLFARDYQLFLSKNGLEGGFNSYLKVSKDIKKIWKKKFSTKKYLLKFGRKAWIKLIKNGGKWIYRLVYWFFITFLPFLFNLLVAIFWFLFSTGGLIFLLVLLIIILIAGLIAWLMLFASQPLLNVPTKYSMYEYYVPINNESIADKLKNKDRDRRKKIEDIKEGAKDYVNIEEEDDDYLVTKYLKKLTNSVTSSIIDGIVPDLDKNKVLFFMADNQIDKAKNVAYKCANYSLIEDKVAQYNKEKISIAKEIKTLSGSIEKYNKDILSLSGSIAKNTLEKKEIEDRLIEKIDELKSKKEDIDLLDKGIASIVEMKNKKETNKNYYNDILEEINIEQKAKEIKNEEDNFEVILWNNKEIEDYLDLVKKKLENDYKQIQKDISSIQKNINTKEEFISKQTEEKNKIENNLWIEKEKKTLLENKLKWLAIKYLGELTNKNLLDIDEVKKDIANDINETIKWDLFDGGKWVDVFFYKWYLWELNKENSNINKKICANPSEYINKAYFTPWIKYVNKFKIADGGEIYWEDKKIAYIEPQIDNILDKTEKIGWIEKRNNIIFQKYYNSIIKLYKQLGDTYVLKNWLSWNFNVLSKGLLGMEIKSKDGMVNIYNPFLFDKYTIELNKQDNTKKAFLKKDGFNIDVSNFDNWFYDYKVKKIPNSKTASNTDLDVIYDSQTKSTYIPISVWNKFIQNTCNISWTLNKNLTMLIKVDGNNWNSKSFQAISWYNTCMENTKKNAKAKCYPKYFTNSELKDKKNDLLTAYESQTTTYCNQLNKYIWNFWAIREKDKLDKNPSSIKICSKKNVYFDYYYNYDVKVFDEEGDVYLDTNKDKYHLKKDNYFPYLYRISIPYKVCYTIDNVYLFETYKNQLNQKGWVIKKTKWDSIWLVNHATIKLKLEENIDDKNKGKTLINQTNKILFQALHKGSILQDFEALLNEEIKANNVKNYKRDEAEDDKNKFYTYPLWIELETKTKIGDKLGFISSKIYWEGEEKIKLPNWKLVSDRYTSQITRYWEDKVEINKRVSLFLSKNKSIFDNSLDLEEEMFDNKEEYLKNVEDRTKKADMEDYVENLMYIANKYLKWDIDIKISWDEDVRNFFNKYGGYDYWVVLDTDEDYLSRMQTDPLQYYLPYINRFKLQENVLLSTVMNYIKGMLFNIDLASLQENNEIQNLIFLGDENQIRNYYETSLYKDIRTDYLGILLNKKIKTIKSKLKWQLQEIKDKLDKTKQEALKEKGVLKTIVSKISDALKESYDGLKGAINWYYQEVDNSNNEVSKWKQLYHVLDMNKECIGIMWIDKDCILREQVSRVKNYSEIEESFEKFFWNLGYKKKTSADRIKEEKINNVFKDTLPKAFYTFEVNPNRIVLNPFYSLFHKNVDTSKTKVWNKKLEKNMTAKIVNIIGEGETNDKVFNTYWLNKNKIDIFVENLLNNAYINNKFVKNINQLVFRYFDTNILDYFNSPKLKDIDDVEELFFGKIWEIDLSKYPNFEERFKTYFKDYKKEQNIKYTLFDIWLISHINNTNNEISNKIDNLLLESDDINSDELAIITNWLKEGNLEGFVTEGWDWLESVGWYDKDKGAKVKSVLEGIKWVLDNKLLCISEINNQINIYSPKTKEEQAEILKSNKCWKWGFVFEKLVNPKVTTDKNNTRQLQEAKNLYCELTGFGDKVEKCKSTMTIEDTYALFTTTDFIKYLYDNNLVGILLESHGVFDMSFRKLMSLGWDSKLDKSRYTTDFFIKNRNYFSSGEGVMNLDKGLYKFMNKSKIKELDSNQDEVSFYNYVKSTIWSIDRIITLKNLIDKSKEKKLYEILDVYLLDLIVNKNHVLGNVDYLWGKIHLYSTLDRLLNGGNLPSIEQYSLFDALSMWNILNSLQGFAGGVDMEDYYFKILKKAINKEIKCNEIYKDDTEKQEKCTAIKTDLIASNTLMEFRIKMTKYSKEYGFEELWKKIGWLTFFTYNNHSKVWNTWYFKGTILHKQLVSKYWDDYVNKFNWALGNCTWYANFLHFYPKLRDNPQNKMWIRWNAKAWCDNAEKLWYSVKWTKDLSSIEQVKIGDIFITNENYPVFYKAQMRLYGTTYGHVGTVIGVDPKAKTILIEEMNMDFSEETKNYSGSRKYNWNVDRKWYTDWKNQSKCFIEGVWEFGWKEDISLKKED